jgi:hypothetical protein
MKDIRTIIRELGRVILDGAKVPHTLSNPVMRKENGKWYIAFFITFYNKWNWDKLKMPRPLYWALVDVETGELIKRYDCGEKDFSSASFDELIDISDYNQERRSREYEDDFFRKFDNLRNACILNDDNIDRLYGLYLGKLLEVIPENYQKIYFELINQGGAYPVCFVD